MVKTLGQLYLDARRRLRPREGEEQAGFLARTLLCHITGMGPEQFWLKQDLYLCEQDCEKTELALLRLLADEPLAYVLGEWDFYGMTLFVDKNVLIPRDDTVCVTELAIHRAQRMTGEPRVLDLCTGSGCIGLAVSKHVPNARVTLADISRDALAVAKKNIIRHKLSGRVSCVVADARKAPAPYLGEYDIIVSNPPYITTGEMAELPRSVAVYEPHLALHGGGDGLDFYRQIAGNYRKALRNGGCLCLEFGAGQGDDVCRILDENGYTNLERSRDYNQRERAVIARYSREEA